MGYGDTPSEIANNYSTALMYMVRGGDDYMTNALSHVLAGSMPRIASYIAYCMLMKPISPLQAYGTSFIVHNDTLFDRLAYVQCYVSQVGFLEVSAINVAS